MAPLVLDNLRLGKAVVDIDATEEQMPLPRHKLLLAACSSVLEALQPRSAGNAAMQRFAMNLS